MATVTKLVKTVEVSSGVTLTLSVEETQLIVDMLVLAGGSLRQSRRGIADDIRKTIETVSGFKPGSDGDNDFRPSDIERGAGVYFMDSI